MIAFLVDGLILAEMLLVKNYDLFFLDRSRAGSLELKHESVGWD